MDIQLPKDEYLIREGLANHRVGEESVGGKLYLTNRKMIFQAHAINMNLHELIIPYEAVKAFERKNSLLIIPNILIVLLKNGKSEEFIVNNREEWVQEIMDRGNIQSSLQSQ